MIVLELLPRDGTGPGRTFESSAEVVTIGRGPQNVVVVEEAHVSGEHARVVWDGERAVLHDLQSTNGTAVVRAKKDASSSQPVERIRLRADASSLELETGDLIELGSGAADRVTCLRVTIALDEQDSQFLSMKRLDELAPTAAKVERDPGLLSALYGALKQIDAASGLEEVLVAIAESSLGLVANATHATIVLRDDDQAADPTGARMVPVLTRVRGGAPTGPVPITRSVYRKVVRERAAVLAADAPLDVGQTESLMGASIRSTIGVPLWRGDEIIGVLQIDNRLSPRMLGAHDVELLLALAANASLAVANARLIKRLVAAEERLDKENRFLKGREERRRSGGSKQLEIVGASEPMRRVIAQLDKVVDTRVTVLIEGETGTGKELIAAAVHYRSRRRDKLFVAQNCAALAESLLESELFGHKKGSFTGAVDDKKGLFELADGGTLFLDEITETPLSLQSKLLRALQEGEIRPVGATSSKHVNVRIVTATNRNLEEEVKKGRFREDLYYRLKVFPLRLPPLRERREDIPLLATHFLKLASDEMGKAVGGFTQQAMELMMAYDWPGNVRELQNEAQRLAIQVDPGAFVTPELLSPRIRQVEGIVERSGAVRGTLKEMVEAVEKYLILECLREHGGNKTNAAKTLGITREGLHKKLRQYGL